MITTTQIEMALGHVNDPDLGRSLTELGMIENIKVDGKKIEFKISAHSNDVLLGEGTHLRFIVDKERFMSKLG